MEKEKLRQRMKQIISDPEHPVVACGLGVVKDGRVLFSEAVTSGQLPGFRAEADTKFRIASISKLITALGVWQLIEQGRIDPEDDVSDYVGFRLRNPAWPEIPITVKMLMSHTSSIREGGGKPGTYNIPYGHHISEFFTPGKPYHNPHCWALPAEKPGQFFAYCNMNYCLLGSIIENVSGERFDRYMVNHIFAPLGLSCGFNVAAMPEEVKATVGTLYRKLDAEGNYDPAEGTWVPQCDDFSRGYPTEDYADYVIGTNGSLFGPMGSLRVSLNELCILLRMFCGGGNYGGVRILKPETVERMFTPVWSFDPQNPNGDTYGGMMNCYGMGPHIFTNRPRGDRVTAAQTLSFAGHTADAYGLLGGMLFDRRKGNGLIYIVAGYGSDKDRYFGQNSAFYGWEEDLLAAGADFAQFDYT